MCNTLCESDKCYAELKNLSRINMTITGDFQLPILYSVYSLLEKAKIVGPLIKTDLSTADD